VLFYLGGKMYQTVVKNVNATQMGSAKFEISADGINWTDLGAMRGVVFTETFDRVEIWSDNAGKIKDFIKNHQASLAGDLMEISLADINSLRGGIDTYTSDSGVSETLKSGGKTTITAIQARVTNTNERAEIFRITVIKAVNNKGIVLSFNSSEADDVNVIPIEILGSNDVSKTPGEQLFEIYNEQGIGAVS
jgi:hypothetical protein